MKKLALIAAFATLAPMAAFAQSCSDGYWDEDRQACVPMREIIAETIEDFGSGTSVQPYTDSTATYIRNYGNNEGGVVSE